MPRLHVICKDGLHVKKIGNDRYESGYWPLTEVDTTRLVGGTLYLHETKAERSYFGGIVESSRRAAAEWPEAPERFILTLRATRDARGQRWEGRDDSMAWIGGVLGDEI